MGGPGRCHAGVGIIDCDRGGRGLSGSAEGWHAYALLAGTRWNDLEKQFSDLSAGQQEAPDASPATA